MIFNNTNVICLLLALLLLSGCASQPPTIAHVHIGHVLDGWPDTPNQEGLFVTAEHAADAAVKAAQGAAASQGNLSRTKRDVYDVIVDTNPTLHDDEEVSGKKLYGVKNALAEAVHHMMFASESPDVSANIRNSAPKFEADAQPVLARCDLITALGNEILISKTPEEANALSRELLKLVLANRNGDDSDGDGTIGSTPEEYGLKQLRAELEAIVNREDPPYTTVNSWYLFNLVRLPSGEWIFRHLGAGGASGQSRGY